MMVLTYHEAEEAGARVLAWTVVGDPDALCEGDHPEWAHWTNESAAVLDAVGYADLLAEIERGDADSDESYAATHRWDVMLRGRALTAETEVERLRFVERNLASAREAGRSYRDQRDAARAALDRVRVLADGLPDAPRVRLIRANLRAAVGLTVTDTPTEICEWCHSPQHETRRCPVHGNVPTEGEVDA